MVQEYKKIGSWGKKEENLKASDDLILSSHGLQDGES